LEAGTLAEICDFTKASNNLRATGFDNNFEGLLSIKTVDFS